MNALKLTGFYFALLGLLLVFPAQASTSTETQVTTPEMSAHVQATVLVAAGDDDEDVGCDPAAGDVCLPDDGPPVITD